MTHAKLGMGKPCPEEPFCNPGEGECDICFNERPTINIYGNDLGCYQGVTDYYECREYCVSLLFIRHKYSELFKLSVN